jgi:SAM-dependent methyltransferase
MHEILRNLAPGSRVLDLGSRTGSFSDDLYPRFFVIRLDLEASGAGGLFVQADAARLPFEDASFDAVIANHSLEHVTRLDEALGELGRVLRGNAALYVAVPDASTITDGIYRWVFHGGGHVNSFRSQEELVRRIHQATKLRPVSARTLHSSLGFLGAHYFRSRRPLRLWLFGGGNLRVVAVLNYWLRVIDRWLGTRASIYGWALYFGNVVEDVDTVPWTNVCVKCGGGHSSAALMVNDLVRRHLLRPDSYHCPTCGVWNLFTTDRSSA